MLIQIKKDYGNTNFITGMRAFAAFAIVLIHAGGAGLRDFGLIGNAIVDLGKNGVYAFFVISGFSVANSFELSRNYFDYLNKRLWRIAPLYYFWIAVALLSNSTAFYWQKKFGVSLDVYNVGMHLSFLSLFDYKITNTILGVEWSIPIEVFWYFFVPLFVVVSKNLRVLALLVVGSLAVFVATKLLPPPQALFPSSVNDPFLALHWSAVPYAFSFVLGVAAYRMRLKKICWRSTFRTASLIAGGLVVGYIVNPKFVLSFFWDGFILVSCITFFLILFGSREKLFFKYLFTNKIALFLGTISYGIYLCHFPILGLLTRIDFPGFDRPFIRFCILGLAATVASSLTYLLIERPCLSFGKSLKLLNFTKDTRRVDRV